MTQQNSYELYLYRWLRHWQWEAVALQTITCQAQRQEKGEKHVQD